MSNSKLQPLVEALEQLEVERADLMKQKADYLKEADDLGYPKAVVRNILARRKKEREDVLEADLALRNLESELGMEVLR